MSLDRTRLWPLVTILVCSCQDPASPAGPLALTDFATEVAGANCRLLFECCASASEVSAFTPGTTVTTEAECRAYFESTFGSVATSVQSYVDAGRLRWDGSAARACVASVEAATCAQLPSAILSVSSAAPTGCAPATVGLLELGARCSGSAECASGYCAGDASTRACAASPGEGDACTGTCAGTLYCDTLRASPVCQALLPLGSPCTPGSDGACMSTFCDGSVCAERPPLPYCRGSAG